MQRLLVSAIEHASVLAGGRFRSEVIHTIGVTRSGAVDLERLRAMLADKPPALAPLAFAGFGILGALSCTKRFQPSTSGHSVLSPK